MKGIDRHAPGLALGLVTLTVLLVAAPIGAHVDAVWDVYRDFLALAQRIAQGAGIALDPETL